MGKAKKEVREDMAVAEVTEEDAEDTNNTDTNGDGKYAVETPDGRSR